MGGCIVCTRIRLLLLIHPFISSFFFLSNFQTLQFLSHFSQELWDNGWLYRVYMDNGWVYHVYQNQAAYSSLYSFFFLSSFQTLKVFVALFSGTVRPRRLKLGTHMDNGWVCMPGSGCCCLFDPFISSLFFLFNFQTLKLFVTLFSGTVRLEGWNLVRTWTVGRCKVYTGIRHPFISSFFFLSSFQSLKFSSYFSQELWGLEDLNLVHAWTVGRCIVYTGIKLLLLFVPLFSFLSLQFSNTKSFCHNFLRNYEA